MILDVVSCLRLLMKARLPVQEKIVNTIKYNDLFPSSLTEP